MIISKTPFRISFVGGGTDIQDYYKLDYGSVVSSTINKYLYITVNKRFDDDIRISYSKTEIVKSVDEIQHDLCRECLKTVGIYQGIEITSISDIPSGTGLASSSVYTVGLLNALYSYVGQQKSAKELADIACDIEINKLGHPIGKQDQYAVAFGGLNYFRFNKDESIDIENIKLSIRDSNIMKNKLMLFYTGINRSANNILVDQKCNISNRIDALNNIKYLADNLKYELQHNGFNIKFGKSIREGWKYKRELSNKISNDSLESLCNTILDSGAVGCKILGAGGGGFILVYSDEEFQDNIRQKTNLKEIDFRFTDIGSRIVYFGE